MKRKKSYFVKKSLCALLSVCLIYALPFRVLAATNDFYTTVSDTNVVNADLLSKKLNVVVNGQTYSKNIADFAQTILLVNDSDKGRLCTIAETSQVDTFISAMNGALRSVVVPVDKVFFIVSSGSFIHYPLPSCAQINQNGKLAIMNGLQQMFASKNAADVTVTLGSSDIDVTSVDPNIDMSLLYVPAGTCTTEYKDSSSNRASNVELAASKLNGFILASGQTVSMDSVFTVRTKANGYKDAGTYLNGQVVQATGGGICQVSSTIYNAAMNAGLTAVERHSHSMPVHYLPLGLDAAIASGSKDLKIRNDYPFPVYFETTTANRALTVKVYCLASVMQGVTFELHANKKSATSADTYLKKTINGTVFEDKLLGSSNYTLPGQTNGGEDD